jgi:hypothetical protein
MHEEDLAIVEAELERAGWHPGRSVGNLVSEWSRRLDRPDGFRMFPAARDALAEFGGLAGGLSGPGVKRSRSSFRLDPTLAIGEEDRFRKYAASLTTGLYPLGEAGDGHAFLAIDEQGGVYLLMDDILKIGESIREGLTGLLLGC